MPEIRVNELHYISPIENIPSILEHGILCHNRVSELSHRDISMSEIQERRKRVKVPNGLPLHDYANLYFDAHNPMLSKRRNQNFEICILQISPDVLNLSGVVLSDRNASSTYVRFFPYPDGLQHLDFKKIFAVSWIDFNLFVEWENKSIKCAEVLVPELVLPEYILGAYVYSKRVETKLKTVGFNLPIEIKSSLFF